MRDRVTTTKSYRFPPNCGSQIPNARAIHVDGEPVVAIRLTPQADTHTLQRTDVELLRAMLMEILEDWP